MDSMDAEGHQRISGQKRLIRPNIIAGFLAPRLAVVPPMARDHIIDLVDDQFGSIGAQVNDFVDRSVGRLGQMNHRRH